MGNSRFVASKRKVVRVLIYLSSSGIYRNSYKRPLPVHDGQLARLDMQTSGRGYQLHPGFPPIRITRVALAPSTNRLADISASGRYSSKNRCGAEFNGSVLHVSSHRMWSLLLYRITS
jgi:hypothetical protein